MKLNWSRLELLEKSGVFPNEEIYEEGFFYASSSQVLHL